MKIQFNKLSIEQAEEFTRLRVNKIIKDPKLLGDIGDLIIKDIKFQVRRGISPVTGLKFDPLSEKRHPFLYGIYGRLDRSFAKTKKARDKLINLRAEQADQGYNYVEIRKYISESTKTHPTFSPKRSNLTITGQLLNAMTRTVSSLGTLTIKFINSIHTPYKIRTSKGLRDVGKPIDNDKLAEYVNAKRPFFGVRKTLLPQLKTIVIRYIRRNL